VSEEFEQAAGPVTGDDPATGDHRVDEAVAKLASLADMPADQHPEVLGEVYQNLSDILGEAGDDSSPA